MSVLPASTPLSPAALTPQKTVASTLPPHAVSRLRQARLARSTRPFLARGGPKGERCEGCRLRPSHCMCALRPELATRAAFCLLMHDAEPLKPSNTGWLIADVVKDTHAFGWSRTELDPQLEALLADPQWQPYVVFPGEYTEPAERVLETLDGGDSRALQSGRRPLFILLDATWSEARKMFRKSPYLDGNRLGTDHLAHDLVAFGVLALADHAGQHVVVQHKGIDATRLQHQKALELVLAHQRLEVQLVVAGVLAQNLHRRRARDGAHIAPLQLLERGDARVGTHGHAHLADIGGQAECNLLLTREVVGHAGAVEIGRAVVDQRHGVLRRQHHVLDLGLWRDRMHHPLAKVHVIADELLVRTDRVGHGNRSLPHPQHHGAAGLPALQSGRCGQIHRRVDIGTDIGARRFGLARGHGRTRTYQRCCQPCPFQRLAHHPLPKNKSAETPGHRRSSPTRSGTHPMHS